MKNLLYTIAKSIVEKHEKTVKNKNDKEKCEHLKRMETKKVHDALIGKFKKRFLDEVIDEFKKNNFPKFKVGEKVVTNWYGSRDAWEGSVCSLQSHIPYRGPIDVEIKEVVFDYSELSEYIDEANNRGHFDEIELLKEFGSFRMILYKIDYRSKISWAYTIRVIGDEKEYWRYSWRENKLLSVKSKMAKYSKKAFKNEVEVHKLNEEIKVLEEKIFFLEEKIKIYKSKFHIKNDYSGMFYM